MPGPGFYRRASCALSQGDSGAGRFGQKADIARESPGRQVGQGGLSISEAIG